MRIGINGSDKLVRPDLASLIAEVEASEVDGFASYWLAQTGLVDATSTLARSQTTSATRDTKSRVRALSSDPPPRARTPGSPESSSRTTVSSVRRNQSSPRREKISGIAIPRYLA